VTWGTHSVAEEVSSLLVCHTM